MSPAVLILFFAIVLVVFVGSGVLGMLQSQRRRLARTKQTPSKKPQAITTSEIRRRSKRIYN